MRRTGRPGVMGRTRPGKPTGSIGRREAKGLVGPGPCRPAATRAPAIGSALFALLLAACTPFGPQATTPPPRFQSLTEGVALQPEPEPYPVTRVVDGDTVKLRRQGQEATVRLLGINSPESVDPRRPVQCFGREAGARMRLLVDGQRLYFAFDPRQEHVDRNGRLLGYLWREDGLFVNLEMVRGGYANEYTYDDPYTFRALFRQTARQAESAGNGLWAADTCAGDFAAPAADFGDHVERSSPEPPVPAATPGGSAAFRPGPRLGEIAFDGQDPREPDEYVEILNPGPPLDLDGWLLSDADGHVFDFPRLVLAQGGRCRVYTNLGLAEHCGLSFGSREAIWGNGGDIAQLLDPDGRVVDERCWGRRCPSTASPAGR